RTPIQIEKLPERVENIDGSLAEVGQNSKLLLERMGLTEKEERILRFTQLVGSVKTKVSEIAKVASDLVTQTGEYKVATLMYNEFSSIKKERIQFTYDVLQADVQEYF